MKRLVCLIWLFTFGAADAVPQERTTLVRAGTLIDGKGGDPIKNAWILIRGDRIVSVGQGAPPDGDHLEIDLSQSTVLPGLIDCHTHLTTLLEGDWRTKVFSESPSLRSLKATRYAREILHAGFTTVRDVGGNDLTDVALRDAIKQGYVEGPRMYVAGHGIGITGGHCDLNGFRPKLWGKEPGIEEGIADGVDEVRKAVRYACKYGADHIKTCATGGVLSEGDAVGATQYSLEELKVMVEEAKNAGRKVAAHAHGNEGIKLAVKAGVASIEHGSILDGEAIRLMKQHGTYLVPTLYVGDAVLKMADEGILTPKMVEKAREIVPKMRRSFEAAAKARVKIAFGTDVGVFPHRDAPKEFALMVKHGMSPMEAILAATANAADLIGNDEIGLIEKGRFADLVAVKGDPLKDVREMERVHFVMKAGKVVRK